MLEEDLKQTVIDMMGKIQVVAEEYFKDLSISDAGEVLGNVCLNMLAVWVSHVKPEDRKVGIETLIGILIKELGN